MLQASAGLALICSSGMLTWVVLLQVGSIHGFNLLQRVGCGQERPSFWLELEHMSSNSGALWLDAAGCALHLSLSMSQALISCCNSLQLLRRRLKRRAQRRQTPAIAVALHQDGGARQIGAT
jgi:hypothetical protein